MTHSIDLKYGASSVPFEYDPSRFTVVGDIPKERPLSDIELGTLIDSPFESQSIEDVIGANESVLIVVPDATRSVGAGQIVNLLVRRLIAGGVMPFDISIMFATGLHRPATPNEKASILTPFILQRVKTYDHDPNDLGGFLNLGDTESGIPVELNRRIVESDHVMLIGGVQFHYFAGFTGGRKLICPGLASKRTIVRTHGLAFDSQNRARAANVGPGVLDRNPVHEAFVAAVELAPPTYSFNSLVDGRGNVTDLVCGEWKSAHLEACRRHAEDYTVEVTEKRDIVIVSCGGLPHDINMIQAHKAIETASIVCQDGGTILVLAECPDGPGSTEFARWFSYGSADELAGRLAEKYTVGGQTAWSLRQKAERYDVRILTDLSEEMTRSMGLKKLDDFAAAFKLLKNAEGGYILPYGSKFLPQPK